MILEDEWRRNFATTIGSPFRGGKLPEDINHEASECRHSQRDKGKRVGALCLPSCLQHLRWPKLKSATTSPSGLSPATLNAEDSANHATPLAGLEVNPHMVVNNQFGQTFVPPPRSHAHTRA